MGEDFDALMMLDHKFQIIRTFAKSLEPIPIRNKESLKMDLAALCCRLEEFKK